MGNELSSGNENSDVINNILDKLKNDPMKITNLPSNSKTIGRLRNERFVRGDDSKTVFRSETKPRRDPTSGRSISPVQSFYEPPSSSNSRMQLQIKTSPTINTARLPVQPQPFTPKGHQSQLTEFVREIPQRISHELFNKTEEESNKKLRSSSASHVSNSPPDRRILFLESNLQNLEKKYEVINRDLHNSRIVTEELKNNLHHEEAKKLTIEANLRQANERITFEKGENHKLFQEILQLRNLLGQKDRLIYDGDIRMKSQENQIIIMQAKAKESAEREIANNREIENLSSQNLELNISKAEYLRSIQELEESLESKNDQIKAQQVQLSEKSEEIQKIQQLLEDQKEKVLELIKEDQINSEVYESQISHANKQIEEQFGIIRENEKEFKMMKDKLDQAYEGEIEYQENIHLLEADIVSHKELIDKLQGEIRTITESNNAKDEQLKDYEEKLNGELIKNERHAEVGEKILNDFHAAKKVGQKQVQFLENRIEELEKEKEILIEEVDVAKNMRIERNKAFERQIIYDLKKENGKLWEKLIEKDGNGLNNGEDIPFDSKFNSFKEKHKQIDSKNELEERFLKFVQNLEGEKEQDVRDLSRPPIPNEKGSMFYQQKCAELEKMVSTHIEINKNLRDELERSSKFQLECREMATSLEKMRVELLDLKQENIKLKEKGGIKFDNESRIKELNEKYLQERKSVLSELENEKAKAKRLEEEIKRLHNEIDVYKKWQQMFEDLNKKYEELLKSETKHGSHEEENRLKKFNQPKIYGFGQSQIL